MFWIYYLLFKVFGPSIILEFLGITLDIVAFEVGLSKKTFLNYI